MQSLLPSPPPPPPPPPLPPKCYKPRITHPYHRILTHPKHPSSSPSPNTWLETSPTTSTPLTLTGRRRRGPASRGRSGGKAARFWRSNCHLAKLPKPRRRTRRGREWRRRRGAHNANPVSP